jgi:hypothetical protein
MTPVQYYIGEEVNIPSSVPDGSLVFTEDTHRLHLAHKDAIPQITDVVFV